MNFKYILLFASLFGVSGYVKCAKSSKEAAQEELEKLVIENAQNLLGNGFCEYAGKMDIYSGKVYESIRCNITLSQNHKTIGSRIKKFCSDNFGAWCPKMLAYDILDGVYQLKKLQKNEQDRLKELLALEGFSGKCPTKAKEISETSIKKINRGEYFISGRSSSDTDCEFNLDFALVNHYVGERVEKTK